MLVKTQENWIGWVIGTEKCDSRLTKKMSRSREQDYNRRTDYKKSLERGSDGIDRREKYLMGCDRTAFTKQECVRK